MRTVDVEIGVHYAPNMEADHLGPYGDNLPARLRAYWPTDLVRLVFLQVAIVLLMLWMSLTFDAFDI